MFILHKRFENLTYVSLLSLFIKLKRAECLKRKVVIAHNGSTFAQHDSQDEQRDCAQHH